MVVGGNEGNNMGMFDKLKQAIKNITRPAIETLKSVVKTRPTIAKEVKRKWEQRKAKEEADKIRKEYYDTTDRRPSETPTTYTDAILQGIEHKISHYKDSYIESYAHGAKMLERTLASEIQSVGRERVARACESAPAEAIRASDIVIFSSSQEQKESGLMQFVFIITGTVLMPETAKELGDILDKEDSGYTANQNENIPYE